jgi:hypothetical protein
MDYCILNFWEYKIQYKGNSLKLGEFLFCLYIYIWTISYTNKIYGKY